MDLQQEKTPRLADLRQVIERRIMHRTLGRVRGLEVELFSERIEIRGRVASYHLKQLALQGVLDTMGRSGWSRLNFEIQVSDDLPRSDSDLG